MDHVVDVAFVVLVEFFDEHDILAHEVLVGDLHDLEAAVGLEHDEVVVLGDVEEVFFLLHACAEEAFLAVYIEFLVREGHMHGAHLAEFRDFRLAVATFAVLLEDILEVVYGVVGEVFLVVVHFLDLLVEFFEEFVGLLAVKTADTAHRDFG